MRHTEDALKWDSTELLQDDESDFLLKLIRNYRSKRTGFKPEELMRITPQMTKKCYNSIELIYKEMLTENYWREEYDKMRVTDPYICT